MPDKQHTIHGNRTAMQTFIPPMGKLLDRGVDVTKPIPQPVKGRNGPVIRRNAEGEVIPNPPTSRQKGTKAERDLLNILLTLKVSQRRTGFPDFAILDGPEGIPIGFIEVKRNRYDHRRYDQIAFQRFCENFAVPYLLWSPGVVLPKWVMFVSESTIGGAVLRPSDKVRVPARHGGRIARKMKSIALHG